MGYTFTMIISNRDRGSTSNIPWNLSHKKLDSLRKSKFPTTKEKTSLIEYSLKFYGYYLLYYLRSYIENKRKSSTTDDPKL